MGDLAAFLLARIAEDEASARAATPGPWRSSIEGRDHLGGDDVVLTADEDLYPRLSVDGQFNRNSDNDQDHIARHDPARVLAECEAKRTLVNSFEGHLDGGDGYAAAADMALCALALPYADHPDYREEWKP